MQGHHPNSTTNSPSFTTTTSSNLSNLRQAKRHGNYNCGRCDLPKKGHSCHGGTSTTTLTTDSSSIIAQSSSLPTTSMPSRHPFSHLHGSLSFDDNEVDVSPMSDEEDLSDGSPKMKLDSSDNRLPWSCLWEVLRRSSPASLLLVAKVCKWWRDCTRKLWQAAEELRLWFSHFLYPSRSNLP